MALKELLYLGQTYPDAQGGLSTLKVYNLFPHVTEHNQRLHALRYWSLLDLNCPLVYKEACLSLISCLGFV